MMTNRIKAQGARLKAKGSRFFPCTLYLEPCTSRLASPAVQRGFSLVSAIFLLVVIAALGTFAVTLSTTQQQSAALDVLGSRAYQAARAGIEWGEYQVLTPGGVINCGPLAAPLLNNVTLTGTTLQNFTVTVNCGSAAASEVGATVTMYKLDSTAWQGTSPSPNYVERQMSVTIAK